MSVKTRAQKASVSELSEAMRTYPFSDPNPVPVLGINKKVAPFYPYFMFDGYTDKPITKSWKIVKLENPYISVSILPEVGGKVMGAIEKSTGNEFVYLNHVMKFRAIGIRGPWTSGGIEHNFGLDLGHAPWAAAPVDYIIRENKDGSISCIVGGLDLASRSEWRVEIRLPKDKAFFQTNSTWYNPSPLHHAYLSWENAAFRASDDLQFYFPGTHHIGHDGSVAPWPVDNKGRDLSGYRNNNFGDSKSYHVVGDYRNWFGGYWHNKKFGFGHWAPYADAAGKKLWIWSLSRDGAIWEKLLTDNDGQYIEAQSGAILNQAAERSGYHSPFTQFSHRPYYTESKEEYWFPVKDIGGMSDAGPSGTLYVKTERDSMRIAIHSISVIHDSLIVTYKNKRLYAGMVEMNPAENFETSILLKPAGSGLLKIDSADLQVDLGNGKLLYAPGKNVTERPFQASAHDTVYRSAQRYFRMGEEQNAMRNYKVAFDLYQQSLMMDPGHYESLCRVAEYFYRSGDFEKGMTAARRVLEQDTYHGGGNYIYGNLLLKLGRISQAEEAFSIASKTMEYRSAAFVQLAAINLQLKRYQQAETYSRQAISYNTKNIPAHQYLATACRKLNNRSEAGLVLDKLLELDPLNHYAGFEKYQLHQSVSLLAAFKKVIRNELPHETYLELAITYANIGMNAEAISVLKEAPSYPSVYYWLAWLQKDVSPSESMLNLKKAIELSPAFVFPFRAESIPVFEWANMQQPYWKTRYYLGLLYWNNLQPQKAKQAFRECGDQPDFAPFYLARSTVFKGEHDYLPMIDADLKRALQLDPTAWRNFHFRTEFLFDQLNWKDAALLTAEAFRKFPANPIIRINHAKALLNTGQLQNCIDVLNKTIVLPQEGAQEGHELYELANLSLALKFAEEKKYKQALRFVNDARKWPENLGSGSPYDPDTRLHDYIAAICEAATGNTKKATAYDSTIFNYSLQVENWLGSRYPLLNYISILSLKKHGRNKELAQNIDRWQHEQDSVRNWNITQNNAGGSFDWVAAKYRSDNDKVEILEKRFATETGVTRYRLLVHALKLGRRTLLDETRAVKLVR